MLPTSQPSAAASLTLSFYRNDVQLEDASDDVFGVALPRTEPKLTSCVWSQDHQGRGSSGWLEAEFARSRIGRAQHEGSSTPPSSDTLEGHYRASCCESARPGDQGSARGGGIGFDHGERQGVTQRLDAEPNHERCDTDRGHDSINCLGRLTVFVSGEGLPTPVLIRREHEAASKEKSSRGITADASSKQIRDREEHHPGNLGPGAPRLSSKGPVRLPAALGRKRLTQPTLSRPVDSSFGH